MLPVTPIVLQGKHVRLEPLTLDHAPGLFEQGREAEIWKHLFWPPLATLHDAEKFIEWSLACARNGSEVPFATVDRVGGRVAGTTRYMDIQPDHEGLEIGWTWLGREYRRTPLNTECKLLLMEHAFERLGAVRVQFKTDHLNVQSQKAIERLGAKKEGMLRSHRRRLDGTHRDSVYYSVIASEWPMVKQRLNEFLARS
jgi:N-acetyltransferase